MINPGISEAYVFIIFMLACYCNLFRASGGLAKGITHATIALPQCADGWVATLGIQRGQFGSCCIRARKVRLHAYSSHQKTPVSAEA